MQAERRRTGIVLVAFVLLALLATCERPRENPALAGETAKTPSTTAPKAAPTPDTSDWPVIMPSVAGAFYSDQPTELRRRIDEFLAAATPPTLKRPWAIIVPHAGYRFSGPVAAFAFKPFVGKAIKTVVVLAFAHNPFAPDGSIKFSGVGTVRASTFRTPLGDLPVDAVEVEALIAAAPFIDHAPALFAGEHSLEVELPFIQQVLPDAKLVPLLFGQQRDPAMAESLAKILVERYAGRDNVLLVASTDLSHFHDYPTAQAMDRLGLDFIVKLDRPGLLRAMRERRCEFCGILPVWTLMTAQQQINGPAPVLLDARNSGDTFGERNRVVGYAAVAFERPEPSTAVNQPPTGEDKMDFELTLDQKHRLVDIARKTVTGWVTEHTKPDFEISDPLLKSKGAAFVTLQMDGELRGCIGHTEARLPLWECVREMATAACSQDPRFPPVSTAELPKLDFEITVLTPMQKIESIDEIKVGRDGLMMERGYQRGLLLPQVPVEWGWDRDEFLSHTARKAGLPADAWKEDSVTIYRFQGLVFGDGDPTETAP